jgi:hypothetical protein
MHITKISTKATVSAVIGVFACGILIFIQLQMIKIFKTQAPIVPTQISKLFAIWLGVVIANFGVSFVMYHLNMMPASLEMHKFIAGSIIPLSWLAYFRRSKRVKVYYGANAFE